MAKLNGKEGNWYTDENGQHYFVEKGQTPKEGWEATKGKKMIKGGKYVEDDGSGEEREITPQEYETSEYEEDEFDANNEDDFKEDEVEFDRSPLIDPDEDDFESEVNEILDRLKNESGQYYDARSFAEQKLKDYDPKAKAEALKRFGELGKKSPADRDGTNGWKPSEGATPAYDAGGFYSINEGDEWDFPDGGYVKVEKINGDEVTIRTPGGNRETITKDELSERVKRASKVPASGNNPLPDRDGWRGESNDRGPQTANIDANVDAIAKEVSSKFGESNVKVDENGHILLKNPDGFDPVAIANEDEIPAGAIVKIMPNWLDKNENPDSTYFVKEDRGDRLLLWSPSKSSSFGGYTYEWPKNTMYVPPRMGGRNSNPTEGKQGSEGDSWSAENPKYKDFNTSDATNVKVVEEGEEYEDPSSGKKSKLKIIEYTPYGILKFGRKDRMYGIVGDDYEGGDTHRKGAIVAPSLKSAKEQLKEFTDYYKSQTKEKKR